MPKTKQKLNKPAKAAKKVGTINKLKRISKEASKQYQEAKKKIGTFQDFMKKAAKKIK